MRYFLIWSIIVGAVLFFTPLIMIYYFNKPDIFDPCKPKTYGIVFGASIFPGGKLSKILQDRVDDAVSLYKAKEVKKLVFSGSVYRQLPPGEPKAMERYAMKHGVREDDIILDERGDRTYLTVEFAQRLKRLHPGSSFVFVSSEYHMPRIRFLVSTMEISRAFFYYTPHNIPFYSKEVLREIAAFWFYSGYKLVYKWK